MLQNNFGIAILRNGSDGFDLSEMLLLNDIQNINMFRNVISSTARLESNSESFSGLFS